LKDEESTINEESTVNEESSIDEESTSILIMIVASVQEVIND
jgi:hypothetical protein